jgi:hypothetical protein
MTPETLGIVGLWVNAVMAAATIAIAIFAFYQALISRETARKQLRAYVVAKPYRAFNIDERGITAQVYTTITNVGATFARNVRRSVGVSIRAGPVPEKLEDLGPVTREEGKLVLAPGVDGYVIRSLHALQKDELAKPMTPEGDLKIYAFGRITYEDIFGKPHVTTFCHAYYGLERLPHEGGYAFEHWQAKSCDRHNDAD